MDSHWVNNRSGYRCRHGHTSAKTATGSQPRNLYLREDHATDRIRAALTELGLLQPVGAQPEDPRILATLARTHGLTFTCERHALTADMEVDEYKPGAHQEVSAVHGG